MKPDFDRLPAPELGNYEVKESGAVQLSGAAALRFALMVGTTSPDEVTCG